MGDHEGEMAFCHISCICVTATSLVVFRDMGTHCLFGSKSSGT